MVTSKMTYRELDELLSRMKEIKSSYFGNDISIFDHYIYGDLYGENKVSNALPSYTTFSDYGKKSDTTPSSVIETAVAIFSNALLPNGVKSVHIQIGEADEADKTDAIKKLEELLTKEVRSILADPSTSFNYIFKSVVRDYLNYGNTLLRINKIEKSKKNKKAIYHCVHIPFEDVYFYSRYMNKSIHIAYKIKYTKEELQRMYDEYSNLAEDTKTLTYMFIEESVTSSEYPDGSMIFEYVLDEEQSKIIEVISHNPMEVPVFIAREIKQNQYYGYGTGLMTISTLYEVNMTTAQKSELSLQMPEPALVVEEGDTVAAKTPDGAEKENSLIIRAGVMNRLKSGNTMIGGKTSLQILNQNVGGHYQLLVAEYHTLIEKLKTAYHIDIFTAAIAPTKTATEIIEKRNVAIEVFSGKAAPFYNELLIPVIKYLVNELFIGIMRSDVAAELQLQENINIQDVKPVLFTYEDKRILEKDAVKLQSLVGIYASMPENIVSEEEWEYAKNEALRLYKEM